MRILFDTNVVLDVLLQRHPWLQDAAALWSALDSGKVTGFVTATTLTDIHYIVRRHVGHPVARSAVQLCLDTFHIAPVSREVLERAQLRAGPDFEDDVQIACAEGLKLDAILSRDPAGFSGALVPTWGPSEARLRLGV